MPVPFPLTRDQRDAFDDRGVVRFPGFYPRADIARMADRLWADLERRFGMVRGRPETWTVTFPAQFQALGRSGAFRESGSEALGRLVDAFLGAGCWERPAVWGAPLVTFPTPAPAIPRPAWHLDIGGTERLDPLPMFRSFTFLEPVLPGGGGTLYVAGSHRLALEIEAARGRPLRSKEVCEQLKAEHPWFATLLSAPAAALPPLLGVEGRAGQHRVQLEEMAGDPGDLIVMHPGIVHAMAHNARERPRLMLREWIPRRDAGTG